MGDSCDASPHARMNKRDELVLAYNGLIYNRKGDSGMVSG